MNTFSLKIVTPCGLMFEGQAEKLLVRTIGGDVCILARHTDYVAPLGMGMAFVESGGKRRLAACMGGILSVKSGNVNLVPTTFEWAEQIDPARAQRSYDRAVQLLQDPSASGTDIALAKARLRRALIRKNVAASQ